MRYLSVCSGIEAASVAWHPLGWTPVAFAEIDKFPSAVLAHHYPGVPNWGDLTRFHEWPDAAVDLLVGGTPCQSFSVAGLRAGLADPRGNLALTYLAVVNQYRPRWLVWENVPGVLSSDGGRDFGAFLGGLGELGYGFAYRVLDAQHFGLAQRRKRVFVVGHLGDWRRAAAVLFERESLSGHPAPRREAGQGVAGAIGARTGLSRGCQDADAGHMIPSTGDISHCLNAGGMGRIDYETETLIAHSLRADGFDASEDGTGRGTPLVPVTYRDAMGMAHWPDTDGCSIGVMAFHENQRAELTLSDTAGALKNGGGKPGQGYPALMQGMAVRRLTPRECTRLQGFPDDYLELRYANAEKAHTAQVLHELWRTVAAFAREGWRPGIAASLLTPQVLLAGVHGGWVSWSLAAECAAARRSLAGADAWPQGFLRALRFHAERGSSPYGREPLEQCARELGGSVPPLSYERASAEAFLLGSELWQAAQGAWPLRYALATASQIAKAGSGDSLEPDGPRYKALGNSMAVPVMAWIGRRIQLVEDVMREIAEGAA